MTEQLKKETSQTGVKVLAMGGYGKLIANMTAIIYEKKIIIIDSGKGFEVPEKIKNISPKFLSNVRPIQANFKLLDQYLKNGYVVTTVIITHCHGDHIGGTAELFAYLKSNGVAKDSFQIYTTNYTYAFATKSISAWPKETTTVVQDRTKIFFDGDNSFYAFFLCHSSLHSMAMYFKILGRKILFLPDHRTDYTTKLGPSQTKIDQIIKKIDDSSPDLLICEGTLLDSPKDKVSVPELSSCQSLKNLICEENSKPYTQTIIVSGFATNPEKILTVLEAAKECGRKVLIQGRGMLNGVQAMREIDLISAELESIITKVDLLEVNKNKKNYLVLTTGHQGEYSAGLLKMIRGELPYVWSTKDCVIIPTRTIPKEGPILGRAALKAALLGKRVKIFDADEYPHLHSTGHITYRDFARYMLIFKKTKKIIINHYDLISALNVYAIIEDMQRYAKLDPKKVLILEQGQNYVI